MINPKLHFKTFLNSEFINEISSQSLDALREREKGRKNGSVYRSSYTRIIIKIVVFWTFCKFGDHGRVVICEASSESVHYQMPHPSSSFYLDG